MSEAMIEELVEERMKAREMEVVARLSPRVREMTKGSSFYWMDENWVEPEGLDDILAVMTMVMSVDDVYWLKPEGSWDDHAFRVRRISESEAMSRVEVDVQVERGLRKREMDFVRKMKPRFEVMFEDGYEKEPESLEELFLPILEMVEKVNGG